MKEPKLAYVDKQTWEDMQFPKDTDPLKGEIVYFDKAMKEPFLVRCLEFD